MYLNHISAFDYEIMSSSVKQAITYLKNTDFTKMETGKHEIDGDKIFALVESRQTRLDGNFEAHEKYADIQYMVKGSEYIYYASKNSNLEIIENNMKEKDIAFYKTTANFSKIMLYTGMAMLIFPGEYHQPCMSTNGVTEDILKVVIKIHKDLLK